MDYKLPNYKCSEIDNLFHDLFGYYPNKEGQSYELIVGAVLKILYPEQKIMWDKRIKGTFDKNLYQIDVSLFSVDSDTIIAVEAKDHTKYNSKVKRPELDKLAGSLIEINAESGYFFSATGYTLDATRKSIGSKLNPSAKDIDLFHLRPSTIEDDEGRLKVIMMNIHIAKPDFRSSKFQPVISDDFWRNLKEAGYDLDSIPMSANINFDGKVLTMEADFTDSNDNKIGFLKLKKTFDDSLLMDGLDKKVPIAEGCVKVDHGEIEYNGVKSKIAELKYSIPILVAKEPPFKISSIGIPKLLVKSEDDIINTLITDHQLMGITFHEDGEIRFDGRQS